MKINNIIEQLYWLATFGRPKRKLSAEELFAHPELVVDPVFFLSTGRSGTEWFTHVLKRTKRTRVFHSPTPNLSVQNKFIFQLYNDQQDEEHVHSIASQLLFAGREQHFRYAYKTENRYIETNNHITFFAYTLAKLFPTAKFIHLYRHPGDFVTSGLNRGWFDHNLAATEKIIRPTNSPEWEDYSSVQRIGWVWNETNLFIEKFKEINPQRVFSFDFSKRDVNELLKLFSFLDIPLSRDSLSKHLSIKRNAQKNISVKKYDDWDESDKVDLKKICQELSLKYKFEL